MLFLQTSVNFFIFLFCIFYEINLLFGFIIEFKGLAPKIPENNINIALYYINEYTTATLGNLQIYSVLRKSQFSNLIN